jgi:hypothetical protein
MYIELSAVVIIPELLSYTQIAELIACLSLSFLFSFFSQAAEFIVVRHFVIRLIIKCFLHDYIINTRPS